MSDDNFDYSTLTRETVRWLRSHGFDACDSGDGVTNVQAGMEGALEFPHVHCRVEPDALLSEAARLEAIAGPVLRRVVGAQVDAAFWPRTGTAIVSLYGVSDAHLAEHAAAVVWRS